MRPIETFVHKNKLCIVMELCSGGDLYSRDPYTEDEAARIVGSIISAVSFMHDNHIVHRDIKYENILFANDSPMSEIKLIDFGLSKKYASDSELTEGVGTVSCISEFLKMTSTLNIYRRLLNRYTPWLQKCSRAITRLKLICGRLASSPTCFCQVKCHFMDQREVRS